MSAGSSDSSRVVAGDQLSFALCLSTEAGKRSSKACSLREAISALLDNWSYASGSIQQQFTSSEADVCADITQESSRSKRSSSFENEANDLQQNDANDSVHPAKRRKIDLLSSMSLGIKQKTKENLKHLWLDVALAYSHRTSKDLEIETQQLQTALYQTTARTASFLPMISPESRESLNLAMQYQPQPSSFTDPSAAPMYGSSAFHTFPFYDDGYGQQQQMQISGQHNAVDTAGVYCTMTPLPSRQTGFIVSSQAGRYPSVQSSQTLIQQGSSPSTARMPTGQLIGMQQQLQTHHPQQRHHLPQLHHQSQQPSLMSSTPVGMNLQQSILNPRQIAQQEAQHQGGFQSISQQQLHQRHSLQKQALQQQQVLLQQQSLMQQGQQTLQSQNAFQPAVPLQYSQQQSQQQVHRHQTLQGFNQNQSFMAMRHSQQQVIQQQHVMQQQSLQQQAMLQQQQQQRYFFNRS